MPAAAAWLPLVAILTSACAALVRRKRGKLQDDRGSLSFDEKMKADQQEMTNMMYGGTAIMLAGCLGVLLPLLATQPS